MKKLIVVLVLAAAGLLLFLFLQGDEEIEAFTGVDDIDNDDAGDA